MRRRAAVYASRAKTEGGVVAEKTKGEKFVLYRDAEGGYRWRLRSPTGETLAASAYGHREKGACEAEVRSAMADHPGAGVLDASSRRGAA